MYDLDGGCTNAIIVKTSYSSCQIQQGFEQLIQWTAFLTMASIIKAKDFPNLEIIVYEGCKKQGTN